jgi:hypothetical protein
MAMMNDGVVQGNKFAELALAISEKAAVPLREQISKPMTGPWASWFNAAA